MKAVYKAVDVVHLGLKSLSVHKVRSLMSALGIIIGVWGVIGSLAVSEGTSFQAQQILRELGSDNIIIKAVKPATEEAKASAQGGAVTYGLTRIDIIRLRDNIPGVRRCAVAHRTLKNAHVGTKTLTVSVIATEPIFADVTRTDLLAGRFISHTDMIHWQPYWSCVLTEALAKRLFTYLDPIGQSVRLNGEPFTVVGILRQLPRAMGEEGGNSEYVLIPLPADHYRFGEYTIMWSPSSSVREKVEVSQVILQMEDEKAVVEGAAIARSLLDRYHDKNDYAVTVPVELIEKQKEQSRLFNIMSLLVASISLVVGGIGIVNIMLASVTERTREIGIRRALGAKRADVVVQFLVEAVALTLAGGVVGVGSGLLVPWAVETAFKLKAIITGLTLVLPFAMAIVVGLVSGLYPAMRAARLDPIVALRHE